MFWEAFGWIGNTYIKYLKASNVEDADEMLSGLFGVELLVDS